MIKPIVYLVFLFTYQSLASQYDPICNPSTGLKSATRIWKTKNRKGKTQKHKSTAYFDQKGKLDSIISTINNSYTHFVYRGDSLIYVINDRLINPRKIDSNAIDLVYKKPIRFIDTINTLAWNSNALPTLVEIDDSTLSSINYINCSKKIDALIRNDDTLYTVTYIRKNGLLAETYFEQKKKYEYTQRAKYFGYKLNKKGDWKKRKYQNKNEPIIVERRKLKYY